MGVLQQHLKDLIVPPNAKVMKKYQCRAQPGQDEGPCVDAMKAMTPDLLVIQSYRLGGPLSGRIRLNMAENVLKITLNNCVYLDTMPIKYRTCVN